MALSKINTNSITDDAVTTAKVNPTQTDITSVGTLTGLTVDGDATLTGANYNVTWDKSENALEFADSANLTLGDNAKIKIGTGDDLQIYHDGSNSYIDDSGTGSLFLRSNNIIMHKYTGENLITATADAEVNLYYNDSLKLSTTSNGVEIKNGATGQQPLLLLKDMNSGVVADDEGGGLYWYTNDSNGTGNNLAIIQKYENSSGGAGFSFETGTGGSRSEKMRLKNSNGLLYVPGAYSVTTSSAANMYIQSDGAFYRSTSSKRYKNTIKDATHGLADLLKLRSVTYKGNNDGNFIFGGLIAEEVHDAGLTEFVQYNDDDEPDALSYGNMVSLCIKAIQEQQEQIKTLEAKVKALEEA